MVDELLARRFRHVDGTSDVASDFLQGFACMLQDPTNASQQVVQPLEAARAENNLKRTLLLDQLFAGIG